MDKVTLTNPRKPLSNASLKLAAVTAAAIFTLGSVSTRAELNTYTNTQQGPNLIPLGYPVPIPVDSQSPVDGFRSYASLNARHQDLMISSDKMTGEIIGTTRAGRDIWAYVLSDADDVTTEGTLVEPAMLHNGGIHAREWQTPEAVTGIMERIIGQEDDEGFYQYLLENNKIVLIPVLNVDGFLQTQRFPDMITETTFSQDSPITPRDGRMRRKNMLDVDEFLLSEDDSLLGVDLNRNNNPWWNTNPSRSSPDNRSLVHHGAGPASEPETQALQAAAELGPSERLRFYIDNHSFSQIYFTPLTGNGRRDVITAQLANKMRAVNAFKYRYGPSQPGGGIGSTDEYFAYTYQIPSYTLETEPLSSAAEYGGFGVTRDGFILPDSEVARMRTEIADASVIGYYSQAGPPSVSAVEVRDTATDTVVFAGEWQVVDSSTRDFNVSTAGTLDNDVEYRIKVTFNKPMRWRGNAGAIANYPGQSITLAPAFNLEGIDGSGNPFDLAFNGLVNDWLDTQASGSGFVNYKDDSFASNFTVPASTPLNGATLVQLKFSLRDLANNSLDASPATVTDWNNGSWVGYENTNGSFGDAGGIDRTIRLVDDGSPGFQAPGPAPAPNPTPPPPTGGGGGGGGGSFGWLLLALLLPRFFRTKAVSLER